MRTLAIVITILLVLIGNAADYRSTVKALRRGKRELNPIINRFGLVPVKVVGTLVQIGLVLAIGSYGLIGAIVICAGYLYVARHNNR